jgi:hypothetical protein
MTLSEEDILARLTTVEDATTERKPYADGRGWVKTVVAFSNSLAVDQPGVLFIGVDDKGVVQEQQPNFEDLQKKVSGEVSNIYPPVYPTILVREKDGRKFIAVIVYGSADLPHFAGQPYVRDGTASPKASHEHVQELFARRFSKVSEILKWKDKPIQIDWLHPEELHFKTGRISTTKNLTVKSCGQHWVTLEEPGNTASVRSISLRQVELNYNDAKQMLILEIYPM